MSVRVVPGHTQGEHSAPYRRWFGSPGARLLQAPSVVGSALVAGVLVISGAATAVDPRLGVIVAVAGVAAWLAATSSRASTAFLAGLGLILAGYATLDRGFAHLGVDPIYVGEVVLGIGVIATAARANRLQLRLIPILLATWMAWGVLRTLPFLPVYGLAALRDGVTYGYGLITFAIIVSLTHDRIPKVIEIYGRLVPLLLVWIPIGLVATSFSTNLIPRLPGSNVYLLQYKPGDAAVHMAGIAAFILVGLDGRRVTIDPLRHVGTWALWLVGAATAAIFNRGGMLALASVAFVPLFTRSARRWVSLATAVASVVSILLVVNPQLQIGDRTRTISMGQVIDNVTSVISSSQDSALQGTKDFRLRWWGTIVDYTVGGPYFWGGKGFGINLADADGFQVLADDSLRAPHNGHVEILARMGVPGLLLWVLLQATFAAALLRAGLAAHRRGATEWTARFAWVFVYWLAMIVDMSFDPYLQGPQGGIWFWAVFGFGLVLLEAWRRHEAKAESQGSSRQRSPAGG